MNDVLWASRLESGSLPNVIVESCDVGELAKGRCDGDPPPATGGLHARASRPRRGPGVAGDPESLPRAREPGRERLKYSPDGGRDRGGIEPIVRAVRFAVADRAWAFRRPNRSGSSTSSTGSTQARARRQRHRASGSTSAASSCAKWMGEIWSKSSDGEGSKPSPSSCLPPTRTHRPPFLGVSAPGRRADPSWRHSASRKESTCRCVVCGPVPSSSASRFCSRPSAAAAGSG